MKLRDGYFHCFLGNGTDAVLVGYTGSMVPDEVSGERCYWYKSDRYYPEDRLVRVVPTRVAGDEPLPRAAGSGWYELAPLGRTWYEVLDGAGRPMTLQGSEQRFVPQTGTLYTTLDYGVMRGAAVTWLHATRSILVERFTFDRDVEFRASLAPGPWLGEGWDTDPFRGVTMSSDAAEGWYDLGETHGLLALRTDPAPVGRGADGHGRCVTVSGRSVTQYVLISDDRQGPLTVDPLDDAIALGYDALRQEHVDFWTAYFARSSAAIPDSQFQSLYDSSMYYLKAVQNRDSGGLPASNLRRGWSSHVFWDAYFSHHALLGANHRAEALEACRFFQRTLEQARRHAREDFGCDGLKWDWEITHDGRRAYGALTHQMYQVHNNGAYSNLLMRYYEQTQDRAFLAEFYPILEGLARFFLHAIVQRTGDAYDVGYLVGILESPIRVRNDGSNVSATIAILRNCARAAEILGREDAFTSECNDAAARLTRTLDALFNGRYFQASEEEDAVNMSSLQPMFPQEVVAATDPRAIATTDAYLRRYHGRMPGQGGQDVGWSAGVLAAILARQGRGELAWQVLETTRAAICEFGGMAEIVRDGEWNMQYFGTAQAAVCGALQEMLLQHDGTSIVLFRAVPPAWEKTRFENLLSTGFSVSATLDRGCVEWTVRNDAPEPLSRQVRFGERTSIVELEPGEVASGAWAPEPSERVRG